MRSSLPAACLVSSLVCATQGCGRLGFASRGDAPSEFGVFEAGVATGDASTWPYDASVLGPDAGFELDAAPRDAAAPSDAAEAAADAAVATDAAALPMDAASADPIDGRVGLRDGGSSTPDARVPVDAGFSYCSEFGAALFCSDFSEGLSRVSVKERGGSVSVVEGAVRLSTRQPDSTASIAVSFAPVFSGILYARFMLRVPAIAPVTAINLFAFTESPDNGLDELTVNLLESNRFDFFVLGTNARFFSQPGALQRNDFQCVEIVLRVGAQGSVRIEVDNEPVIPTRTVDTRLDNGIARVALGIDYAGPLQAATAFEIDDFVVSRAELPGCP
jgi:hypothetical protein